MALSLGQEFRASIQLLLRSDTYARETNQDPWDYSVELPDLIRAGATRTDLRLLINLGLVHHRREKTQPRDNRRSFKELGQQSLTQRTCFVIAVGMREKLKRLADSTSIQINLDTKVANKRDDQLRHFTSQSIADDLDCDQTATQESRSSYSLRAEEDRAKSPPCQPTRQRESRYLIDKQLRLGLSPIRNCPVCEAGLASMSDVDHDHYLVHQTTYQNETLPNWEPHERRLVYRGQVVKRFRMPAVNQETILSAFEEESWPSRIDDPLPQLDDIDPKRRLHDTIKCLNRNQHHEMIRFRGDGTGEGITWELTEASVS